MTREVATILFAISLSCCRKDESQVEFWSYEREKTELSHRLELAEYRVSLSNAQNPKELQYIRNLISEMEVRLWNLQSDRSALISDISRMENRNTETFRMALANQREKCQGERFDTLIAKNGKIYQDVKVVKVEDSGVLIRHQDGAARLRYEDLSDEQRILFGIEESTALAAEERERKETLLYEQRIDMQMADIRKKEEIASADREQKDNLRVLRSRMANNTPREPSLLSQPARPFGTGSIYRRSSGYYSSDYYRRAYRYVYVYPQSPNPFCASNASHAFKSNSVIQSPLYPRQPCIPPDRKASTLQIPIAP
jgi:hypothetical protein